MNLDHTLKITDNIQIQGTVYQQYVCILDFYLESYRSQLNSLKPDKQSVVMKEYGKERCKFLKPLCKLKAILY